MCGSSRDISVAIRRLSVDNDGRLSMGSLLARDWNSPHRVVEAARSRARNVAELLRNVSDSMH